MRPFRSPLVCILALTLVTAICLAEAPDRIATTIDSGRMVPLRGQIQRQARPEYDQGRVDASFQLNGVKLFIAPSASQVKDLKQLLEEQQDPKSPHFHKWLTIQQYADRFGLSHNDVQKTVAWLKSQGLTSVKVANGRDWIVFSGTASQIESVFRTEIHRYNVKGEMHFANSSPPSIPAALSGVANGFFGLDDFRPKPMIKKSVPRERNARPGYYDANTGLGDFLAPNDIATIYDLGPLYAAGIDGTGEKLAIMGQTDVYLADLNNFRSGFGLTPITGCTTDGNGVITSCTVSSTANFQYVLDPVNPTDPGVSTNDLSEADLDLEWSAATARGAQIIFYNSTNVFNSLLDAIDATTLVAPVISLSYGSCEWFLGGAILTTSGPGLLETGMIKASSLGITILNSSGDSGAAECDPPPPGNPPDTNDIASYGLAVSYPASSPEVTGVGGTAIVYPTGFSSTFWGTDNTTNNGGTAQNPPLPEIAWNDDVELPLTSLGGTALSWQESYAIVQTGGGVSNCALQNDPTDTLCVSGFPVPTWQQALVFPTAPPTTGRYSPDVSLLASPNFPGYVYCTPVEELTNPSNGSSTSSCATGIAAAVNGVVSGSTYTVNPSIVGGTSASAPVFAGIVTMLNQYLNSPGLGNINPTLYKLAATPANGAFHHVITGENMVYCAGDTPNPSYEINASYLCPGTTGTMGQFGWQASNADATTGYNLVTGLGSVDANLLFTAWKGTPGSFTLAVGTGATLQVNPGQAGTATIDITRAGLAAALTFTCDESTAPALSASGSVCTVTPSTPTTATSVSVNITTVAPTAQLRQPLGSSRGIFYAALLPGLLGIVFTAGSRKRAVRGLRFLSLILVLGFSTLWLGACSSSSHPSNPGTPAGSYVVTINATTGGASPVTGSTTITLVVQ